MSVEKTAVPDVIMTAEQEAKVRLHEADEDREALENLNRFHDEHGCFSDEFRTF